MKHAVLIIFLLTVSQLFFGQTLVKYGKYNISREEFISAFRKNNLKSRPTAKSYREYLDLYIRYRLKVQAALDLKLDTLPGQVSELQNFKSQIADQYTNDESSLNSMAEEAFLRSQHDIRISYLFVACPKNTIPADTLKAWQKIHEASNALKANKDFGETALLYSSDPFVKNNLGDIGFITVFDLPYAMESVAYHTPVGKYSPVFRTDGGYMILKNTAERKGAGRIHVAQILLIFPYQPKETDKAETKRRADSIYHAIQAGAAFGELARRFSGDNLSYQLGGVIPEFGIGKYESGFEEAAFGLKKDGDVSLPFESDFGYHIVKRISRIPVPAVANKKVLDALKEKVKMDPRIAVSRKQMLQIILKQTKYKEIFPPGERLWDYTDSMLHNKKPSAFAGLDRSTPLFQIGDKIYLAGDWINYRKNLNSVPTMINNRTNTNLLDQYRQTIAFEYYRNHLGTYNKQFAAQVNEFRDGNLLFEIMQKQVWDKASADSAGLKKYFEARKKNYRWNPGAEAIVFNAGNRSNAEKLKKLLEGNMTPWRRVVDSVGGIQADSGRFEEKQFPGILSQQAGRFSEFVTHADNSVQFIYIIKPYPDPAPRNFDEARGLVINDYQIELENKWIAGLKLKYPVSVNETIFKSLPK